MTDPETAAYNEANAEARARIAAERGTLPEQTYKDIARIHTKPDEPEPLGIGAMAKPPQQTALDVQVGGDHYIGHTMGPGEWSQRHRLNAWEANVVKRVFRHNRPGGDGIVDIDKAIDELQKIRVLEYGEKEPDQCPTSQH